MSYLCYSINSQNAKDFCKRFRVSVFCDSYVRFICNTTYCYSSVDIIRTSKNTYRVIAFVAYVQFTKSAEYKSFHTLEDLCSYLDTLSSQLV